MTHREALDRAADRLTVILSHEYEDILLDAWADTWPGGADDWMEQDALIDPAVAEEHRERIFREVMLALAAKCLERGRPDGVSE